MTPQADRLIVANCSVRRPSQDVGSVPAPRFVDVPLRLFPDE